VGSRSKINLAYIAGFLDGDGSLMLQVKKRKNGKSMKRFMFTICFYQDSRHEKSLYWIRNVLNIGYISKRKDGITELRINGFEQVKNILKDLIPFIKFKKKQARAMYRAANLLCRKKNKRLTRNNLEKLIKFILTIQRNNYVTKKKKNKRDLLKILGLTP
jgi:exopolyphosphatase/pppGpp-phosphohydrolase